MLTQNHSALASVQHSAPASAPPTAVSVSQAILDALTDVAMPRLAAEPPFTAWLTIGGAQIPVRQQQALVVGSGAAGLRAAVELKRRGVDVAITTQSAFGGTSACSGSDKQTLHTANSADRGDDFCALAAAISAGGAMNADTAYVEAVGSLRALATLQYLGLPLPQDRLGGVLRYQTDHDETGRATSCGPRTSRLMVQVLAQEALRLEVPIFNHATAVQILVQDQGQPQTGRQVVGVLVLTRKHRSEHNPLGAVVFLCAHLVLAAGGPGELYRDSVYPRNCFGSLGLALAAGVEAVNLTESQFGIGTSREGFPWNLSGTYAQCMPYVYSLDASGAENNFLASHYRSTRELACNTFRKGYQWPFHASRTLDFGSSLFDLAVFREMQAGRRVFMDFNRNPQALPGGDAFDLLQLDDDVATYLERADALLATPIERLRRMNPLAIELYKRYKVDITRDPLEFVMSNQHMNGGLAVDVWGRTSLPGCYAVGEAAGTHGVTRPGGAALNAGQVFALRCSEHIAACAADLGKTDNAGATTPIEALVKQALDVVQAVFQENSPLDVATVKQQVQARMSDHAGMICRAADVKAALAAARQLNDSIRRHGIAHHASVYDAAQAMQWSQMALASEAVLASLDFYLAHGGGSRGARMVCDPLGAQVPDTAQGPMEDMRFMAEFAPHREQQLLVCMTAQGAQVRTAALRGRDQAGRPSFERHWPDFLTGRIFR